MKVKRNDVYIASIYKKNGDMSVLEKDDQLVINIGYSFVPFCELESGKDFKMLEKTVNDIGKERCLAANIDNRLLSTSTSTFQPRFVSGLARYFKEPTSELVGFIELGTEQKKLNRKHAAETSENLLGR